MAMQAPFQKSSYAKLCKSLLQ